MSADGKIHLKSNRVVLSRDLKPEHGETAEAGYEKVSEEVIKDLIVKDREIESREHRGLFKQGEGDISIIITAGDEPGDLRVAVQYEGEIEQYTQCLTQQGELIQQTADWLREIFAGFGGVWDANLISVPCDKGDTRLLELGKLVERLQGPTGTVQLQREQAVSTSRHVQPHAGVTVDVDPKK